MTLFKTCFKNRISVNLTMVMGLKLTAINLKKINHRMLVYSNALLIIMQLILWNRSYYCARIDLIHRNPNESLGVVNFYIQGKYCKKQYHPWVTEQWTHVGRL